MKTITIEVPDNADTAKVIESAQRAADPNWVAVWWNTEDVSLNTNGGDDSDLTEEECREVLRLAYECHDANDGINWNVLTHWADHVKQWRGKE
jgi:hypothetical protein